MELTPISPLLSLSLSLVTKLCSCYSLQLQLLLLPSRRWPVPTMITCNASPPKSLWPQCLVQVTRCGLSAKAAGMWDGEAQKETCLSDECNHEVCGGEQSQGVGLSDLIRAPNPAYTELTPACPGFFTKEAKQLPFSCFSKFGLVSHLFNSKGFDEHFQG